jgi:NAD(P)H-quinone oxidoreductase subunit 5
MPPHDWLLWIPTIVYLVGAIAAKSFPARHWPSTAFATRAAAVAALLAAVTAFLVAGDAANTTRLAALVSLLIAFLGWIITAYSRRYLGGEPGQARYTVSLLLTLAAVSTVVVTHNFLALMAGWTASSLGLHQLLTFYPERRAAVIVAHKKFIASRLADAFLVVAAVVLFREVGSFDLASVNDAAVAFASPPLHAAAVLITLAALLKCAQMPVHGWLIQVMEAPTPVSALLHAGVVNLGGYVLIRMAPLIGATPLAEALLVTIGGLTAIAAGLVMLTRITIKVRLAWSTCSQMGFMLLECGLGLYDLALLHLLAHSVYKAHAFLTAGDAVRSSIARHTAERVAGLDAKRQGVTPWLALPFAALLVTMTTRVWCAVTGLPAAPWTALAFLTFGLSTLLWSSTRSARRFIAGCLTVLLGTLLYLGWHGLIGAAIGLHTRAGVDRTDAIVVGAFFGLYAIQIHIFERGRLLSRQVYEWVYAGFYLDEYFTRLTFRIWPVRDAHTALPNTSSSAPRRDGRFA